MLPFRCPVKLLAQLTVMPPSSNLFLPVIQNREPPSLLRLRDSVLQLQRWSIRPGRILEREHAVISHHVHQAKSLFKLRLRLPRKSNNQIAGERYIAPCCLNPRDSLQILISSVEPLHGIEHASRPALHQQMDMIAKRRHGIDDFDNVAPATSRTTSAEPNSPNARH